MEDGPRIWFDEATGIVMNCGRTPVTVEGTRDALRQVGALLEGKSPRLLLVDLSEAPLKLAPDTRATLLEESARLKLDKQAFVVPNPVVRMLAKAIARVTSSASQAGFFGTMDEAVAWLKGRG